MKILAAVVLTIAAVSLVSPAQACVSVMWREHKAQPKDNPLVSLIEQAQTKLATGDNAGALKVAERVLDMDEANDLPAARLAKAHRIAGEAAMALGKPALAVKHLASAVTTFPGVLADLGQAHIAAGQAQQAKEVLESHIQTTGLGAKGWTVLAEARLRLGDVKGANTAVSEALKLEPDHVDALKLQLELGKMAPPTATVAVH